MSVLPVIGSPIDTFKQLSAAADSTVQNEILQMKDPAGLPPGLLPLGLGELDVPMPVVFLKQFRAADGSRKHATSRSITGPLILTVLQGPLAGQRGLAA